MLVLVGSRIASGFKIEHSLFQRGQMLVNLGCHLGQGYAIGRATSPDRIAQLLRP